MIYTGIRGYIGKFGQGKTMSLVWDCLNALYQGKTVYSNFPIELNYAPPFRRKKLCKSIYVPKGSDLQKIIETQEKCIIAVDETAIYFPTKYWDKLSDQVTVKFHQVRHYDCAIWYTVQRFKQSVARLRELSTEVYECNKYNLGLFTLFHNGIYEADCFDGTPTEKKRKEFKKGARIIFPSEYRRAYAAYDTKYRIESSVLAQSIADHENRGE